MEQQMGKEVPTSEALGAPGVAEQILAQRESARKEAEEKQRKRLEELERMAGPDGVVRKMN